MSQLLTALSKKAAAAPSGSGGRLAASPGGGGGSGGGSTFVFNQSQKTPQFAGAGYTVLHPGINPAGSPTTPPPGDPRGVQPMEPGAGGAPQQAEQPKPPKPMDPPDPLPFILSDPAKRVTDLSKRISKIKMATAQGLGPLTPPLNPSNPTGRDMRVTPMPVYNPFKPGSMGNTLYGTAKNLYGGLLARTYQPKPFATLTDRDSIFAAPYHQAMARMQGNLGAPPNPFAGIARQVGSWLTGGGGEGVVPESWQGPLMDAAPAALQGADNMISYAP